jgi:hypothetical protein
MVDPSADKAHMSEQRETLLAAPKGTALVTAAASDEALRAAKYGRAAHWGSKGHH